MSQGLLASIVAEERAKSSQLAKENKDIKAKHMIYQHKRVNQMLKQKTSNILIDEASKRTDGESIHWLLQT